MIIEKKVKNYTVFVKKDGEKYIEIFKDFLSYNHQVIKVFRNIEDTKVVLINTDYGKYILCISMVWFRAIPIKVTLSCKAMRSELSICPEKDLPDNEKQRIVLI